VLDRRASVDSIALALRAKAPIYVSEPCSSAAPETATAERRRSRDRNARADRRESRAAAALPGAAESEDFGKFSCSAAVAEVAGSQPHVRRFHLLELLAHRSDSIALPWDLSASESRRAIARSADAARVLPEALRRNPLLRAQIVSPTLLVCAGTSRAARRRAGCLHRHRAVQPIDCLGLCRGARQCGRRADSPPLPSRCAPD
jgi:hypothetical protein